MDRKKNVKFQYYKAYTGQDGDLNDIPFDLNKWVEEIQILSLEERKKQINGIEGRLEDIKLIHDDYYALNFMKMDVVSDSYTIKIDEEAKHIDLGEDEYLGRNTVALYDPQYNIIMIECNKGAFNVSAIEKYINDTGGINCNLLPINNTLDTNKCLKENVRKIEVRFADVRNYDPGENASFEKVIETCNDLEGLSAYIEIGVGYSKLKSMNQNKIFTIIQDIIRNKSSISSAKITLCDDEKKSAVYDLLDNIQSDIIPFTVQERGELGFEFMAERMYERYITETRNKIISRMIR